MDDTIGKKIQRIRIERIRETLDTINKIETGKMEVNWYILEKIQNYFKVKL